MFITVDEKPFCSCCSKAYIEGVDLGVKCSYEDLPEAERAASKLRLRLNAEFPDSKSSVSISKGLCPAQVSPQH
ncbi:hypothetical protein [Reinekea sp. G2M2-21]|uniref:hypothetical protein n=1 Tax=Reinekea sp. G2M2-21 TaxID=2788942 RepID=UPI0018AB5D34|nr:hypothetical protein [Reinekea sp. G2M2-21]